MKVNWAVLSVIAAAMMGTGCRTYDYRIVQPPGTGQVVAGQPITFHYDPLDYQLVRYHDRLLMRIMNPTEDRISLLGNRSYVVDPRGESHPSPSRTLAPRSHTVMLLPPRPIEVPYYYGGWYGPWGWPGEPYGFGWYPYYGGYYYWPSVSYYRMRTAYDWHWREGPARLRLTYEREGKTFEHDFEIVREPVK